MGLFSARYRKFHFRPRDPEISMHARPDHPVQGDLLVWSDDYGKMIPASPPIDPDIVDVISDGDLIVWDATDAQLEALTPLFDLDGAGSVDNELLLWDDGAGEWAASGLVYSAPAYGVLAVAGGVAAQAVTSTAAKLTAFDTNGPSSLATVDHTDDSITVTEAGFYAVDFSADYSHAAATGVYFSIREDGVGTAYQASGLADDSVTAHGILELAAGAVITVYVSNNVGGDGNLTVANAQLRVMRIDGPTL